MANLHLEPTPPFKPRADGALGVYRRALQTHRLFVVFVVVAAVTGYLGWRSASTPSYEATAQLLVSPVSAEDPSFLGLPVLRETPGDPTRTIETAAALLRTEQAASRAGQSLRPPATAQQILDDVSLEPQGQSNVVAVTASATSAQRAAAIANAYAKATLVERAASLRQAAFALIPRVKARVLAVGADSPSAVELTQRLSALRELTDGGDPSLSLSQSARAPQDAAGPSSVIVLLLAALAGFAIGSLAAVLREVLTRAIRDEEEAIALYPLPVLARVPVLASRQARAMTAEHWSPPPVVREAFRTLFAQLEHQDPDRVVMITSAGAGDGKTTSAINLAAAIAETGEQVILLDFDLRKPGIGRMLDLDGGTSLATLALPGFTLSDGLVPALGLETLSVLMTTIEKESHPFIEGAKRRLPELIKEARDSAAWVVIDTAPLGHVSDALGIVHEVDDIVVVVRPLVTERRSIATMRELLGRTYERGPTGMLVISTKQRTPSRTAYSYGYGVTPDPDPAALSARRFVSRAIGPRTYD